MELKKRGVAYAVKDGLSSKNTAIQNDMLSSSVRYSKYTDADDGFIDLQFERPPPTIPWKAIGLATVLFLIGSALITVGVMLLSGYIDSKVQSVINALLKIALYSDRTWPVLILGSILFIPGFYHVRIAYYASQGEDGYSFDDIPDFE